MIKFFRGDGWLKLKHGEHGEDAGHAEDLFCHVRGLDRQVAHPKRVSSVASVYLRGLRVSRLGLLKKS